MVHYQIPGTILIKLFSSQKKKFSGTILGLILDVSSCAGNKTFFEIHFKFALDLMKCRKQIKLPIARHTCAPISGSPSHIITLGTMQKEKFVGNRFIPSCELSIKGEKEEISYLPIDFFPSG